MDRAIILVLRWYRKFAAPYESEECQTAGCPGHNVREASRLAEECSSDSFQYGEGNGSVGCRLSTPCLGFLNAFQHLLETWADLSPNGRQLSKKMEPFHSMASKCLSAGCNGNSRKVLLMSIFFHKGAWTHGAKMVSSIVH